MNRIRKSQHRPWRVALLPIAFLLLSATARDATADTLDDVLNVAAQVGLVSKDIATSKPVIECLLGGGNAVTCANSVVNVQEEAQKMLPPTDPNIKLIVNLVQAVANEQWLKVLELAGKSGVSIACELIPGGAIKSFFCSAIAKIAQSKVEAVYSVIVEGDWWNLVTLIDPAIACELMPADIKAVVCSVLLQVVGEVIEVLEDGVALIVDLFNGIATVFTGSQDAPLDAAKYYQSFWRAGNLHWMVLTALKTPGPDIGVWPTFTHGNCVTYYDNHRMDKDDAETLCQKMGDSLLLEAKSYKKLALDAVPAYLKGSLVPRRYGLAAASWGDIPATGVINKANDKILDLYKRCRYDVGKMVQSLPSYSTLNGHPIMQPASVQAWVCDKALNEQFLPLLTMAKAELETKMFAPLMQSKSLGRLGLQQASECKYSTAYNSPNLVITCDSFDKWRSCRSLFFDLGIGLEEKGRPECKVNDLAAGTKLAKEIAIQLGPRCTSNTHTVECTREWKVSACHARAGVVLAGLPYAIYKPNCIFKSTPAYESAKAKAREILNVLNGAGPVDIGPGGQAIPTTVFEANKACYSLPDPLVLKCKGRFDIPELPGGTLQYCKKDPNNDGSDVPCYLDLPDASQVSTEPLSELPTTTSSNPSAPPNPCRMTVNYYVPQAPIVSARSSGLLVNDQFQIQCSYKKVTREVEWPQCDDAARTAMQILKISEESGGRYSGIVAIDGNTVGVSSSPEDGSDFASTKTWKFEGPGAHDVSCQIDNALRYAAEGVPTYLNSAVSFDVSARSDGLTYRPYEPESASQLPVRSLPSEAAPTARDGRFRMLQDEAPANSRTGYTGVRQSQGEVALSNDLNDNNTTGAAPAQPAERSARRQPTPSATAAAAPVAVATPWARIVLSCMPELGAASGYTGAIKISNYEIWVQNSSSKEVKSGQTIFWRASGVSVSTAGFGGGGDKWTREGTYSLQTALPVGAKSKLGSESVPGTITSCEAWAQ